MSRAGVGTLANYYGSVEGGQCLFSANLIFAALHAAETPLIYMSNPGNSGKTLYIHRLYFSSDQNITVNSYRNPTITGGTAMTVVNRTGGSLTSIATLKSAVTTPIVVTVAGTLAKQRFWPAFNNKESLEDGTLAYVPGESILWQALASSGIHPFAANIIWWEK